MTDHEVYLRARLADEEKRLEPGMKAAIEWALDALARIRKSATKLLDAMETCHICGGLIALDECNPTHCENCSSDCEEHEEPECVLIHVLHDNLRKAVNDAD